jgi:hypothetical protein
MTGALLQAQGASIASASTVNLAAATGNSLTITGTTTITSFGTVQAGAIFNLTFSGVLDLTYNATSMILPTAVSIETAVGDVAIMQSLGSGNWKCLVYYRADGSALAGAPINPDEASVIDTTVASLIGDISGFTVNPKAEYRITDAAAGVVRVKGVSTGEISMAAYLEGSWNGSVFIQGQYGRYSIGGDWFIPVSNQYALAPSANEDIDKGYIVNDVWIDTVTGIQYKCTDNTTGAAVWEAQSGDYTPNITPNNGTAVINGRVLFIRNGNNVTVCGLLIADSSIGGLFDCDIDLPINPDNDFSADNEVVGSLNQNNNNILNTLLNQRIAARGSSKLVTINIRDLSPFTALQFTFSFTYKLNN